MRIVLKHSELSLEKERLVLEAIQGGDSVEAVFLNKSKYRQALIHTTQTSSAEHYSKSVCPTLNPVLSYTTILETDSAPHRSCTCLTPNAAPFSMNTDRRF